MYILTSAALMLAMSLVLGVMIALFAKIFEVKQDPRIEQVQAVLPAYNCGICGYPGCVNYAAAIVMEHKPMNKCNPGGHEVAEKIKLIMEAPAV